MTQTPHSQLLRLLDVIARLRTDCPWDAEQTHRSLVNHLVEETAEVVDAIEAGSGDDELVEELGDLLMQVYFHANIAAEQQRFTIEDVAKGIADKLVRRHPYVFGDGQIPDDLEGKWEERKRAEKGRTSSLDGIPEALNVVARTGKVVHRARKQGVPVDLPTELITATEVGQQIVALISRAQASGIDADQATRDALRQLETQILCAERTNKRELTPE